MPKLLLRGYNFRIEIDGIDRGGFRECSGLGANRDPVEYREGTDAFTARKVPGLPKYGNITLKWGISEDTALSEWLKKAIEGKLETKNMSIILMDDTGQDKARWNLREVWPTKWTGPTFNATGNEIAIETLELAHEGVTRE